MTRREFISLSYDALKAFFGLYLGLSIPPQALAKERISLSVDSPDARLINVLTDPDDRLHLLIVHKIGQPELYGNNLNGYVDPHVAQAIIDEYLLSESLADTLRHEMVNFSGLAVPAIYKGFSRLFDSGELVGRTYPEVPNKQVVLDTTIFLEREDSLPVFGGDLTYFAQDGNFKKWGPVVLYGPYLRPDSSREDIRESLGQVGGHSVIHRLQPLVRSSAVLNADLSGPGGEIVHSVMSLAEDASMVSLGVNKIPNPRIIEAINYMVAGGMASDEAIRTVLRVGFGSSGDIRKMESAFNKGRPTTKIELRGLLTGHDTPAVLVKTEDINKYRPIWLKFFGLESVLCPNTPVYSNQDIIPQFAGWNNGAIVVGSERLYFSGERSVVKKFANFLNRNDKDVLAFTSVVATWSENHGFGKSVEMLAFSKALCEYWNKLGRPDFITEKQWNDFLTKK